MLAGSPRKEGVRAPDSLPCPAYSTSRDGLGYSRGALRLPKPRLCPLWPGAGLSVGAPGGHRGGCQPRFISTYTKTPGISGKRKKELLSAEFRKLSRMGGVYT